MHFFIDENLSPNLAKALHYIAQLCAEKHSVVHARTFNGRPGVPDQEWLERLQQDGNWVILSKDRFKKGDREKLAFERAGLTIINLGKDWNRRKGLETAVQLVRWWPTISKEVIQTNGPMLYELSWGISDKLSGRKLPKP